jgi:mannose-1-phosphate guanylyltransferase
MNTMQALILVGGEATRLRPLTCNMPKAMVPVLNTPFLEHVIRYLGGHGVDDIVLAQGHLPKIMDNHFSDGSRFGARLTYSLESVPLNTAGAVKNAEQHLKPRFLVLNGDIFTDLDISAMLRFHIEKKAKVTIALTPVADPTAYGLIETTADGRVTRFLEKPTPEQVTTNMINAGTYILEHSVLDLIPPQTNYSFERQLFPHLLQLGEPVYAFTAPAYWIDIGKPETYFQLHRDLLKGVVRGYLDTNRRALKTGAGCRIHPEAEISGPAVIGDNCTIDKGAKILGPVVLGNSNMIGAGAIVDSSITWSNSRLDARVNIKECLIANDCHLGANAAAEKTVIGDHVDVSPNSRLGPGSRLWPAA